MKRGCLEIRHGGKVFLNYSRNYLSLKRLVSDIKKATPLRKILAVSLLEHLGDIVACEPVVRHVRQNNPSAYIVWMVKEAYRELIDSNPFIDKTIFVHCLSERLMLANSGLFDEVIDLHLSDRYCSLCRNPLKKQMNSPVRLATYFEFGGILSAFSQSAGLPPLDETPKVYIPEAAKKRADELLLPERFVSINCSSNSIEKDWPSTKWMELTEKIQKTYNLPTVEIGVSPLLSGNSNTKHIDLCGSLSILESAEVIRRSKLFIGIDSGPAHLANAVRTPGVIVMGSYLGFKRYLPYSGFYGREGGAEIIYADGPAAGNPVDEVFKAVKKALHKAGFGTTHVV